MARKKADPKEGAPLAEKDEIKNTQGAGAAKTIGIVIGGSLNIRKEPSKEAKIIGTLRSGAELEIETPGKTWHKLKGEGYVMAGYVELR